ncbi:conserved Plasmodium protein, unknown function [Plasmodium gallinaceum]|uniref:Gfo/Idh/MocA-like oxidoreductase N-terminal domain-containing protein n=1 Tax=Plasmodium gallinaceum TaxID=5849 RepID=A0A1J1GXI4_PLAGA|nr:conserved Plasmodium protein, unknown function [Plasmodium gallinaceum]CRG97006.1 conserved Plasmodium protein, unknown function [Plasmodium gallinaceum]
MILNKPSICLICDKEAFKWIPVIINEWKIKYLFCNDEKLKNCFIDTFNLNDTETNTTNDIFEYLDCLNPENVDLLFLSLPTNEFHELLIENIIKQKKFFFVFSSNLPTLNIEKLKNFRTLLNNFNITTNIIYDVKEEFKNKNKQFYWNIFNPLLNEQVFHNLKNVLNELGYIYGVQAESTFIPYFVENEEVKNILFYRCILMISLIEFLFEKSKHALGKCYSIKNENVSINCIAGNVVFDSLNCNFIISTNSPNKIFTLKIYGENGFIIVSYNKEHNCFQLQRCLNHYEYPSLFIGDSQQSALNELKYFVEEKLYTNKYVNNYIDAMHVSLNLWKSEGANISLENENSNYTNENINNKKLVIENNCVSA